MELIYIKRIITTYFVKKKKKPDYLKLIKLKIIWKIKLTKLAQKKDTCEKLLLNMKFIFKNSPPLKQKSHQSYMIGLVNLRKDWKKSNTNLI